MQRWRTSLVISARSGIQPILSTLASLNRLPQFNELEVVVANCCGAAVERAIAGGFPQVKVINLPAQSTIADSRHAAIRNTSGDLVAILHERYHVPANWLDVIWHAHHTQAGGVISGCVGPPRELTLAQWAMFLTEYAGVSPPLSGGLLDRTEACKIPGGNVSYPRAVFEKTPMEGFLWELDFHAALFDRGVQFYREPALVAEFGYPYTVREYIQERVAVSREFARRRCSGIGLAPRLLLAASRFALPLVLLARIARIVGRKKLYAGRFILALPWMAAFSMVQVWGEISGYLSAPDAGHAQSVSHQTAPGPEQ